LPLEIYRDLCYNIEIMPEKYAFTSHPSEQYAVDEHLFNRFADIATFQAYEYLGGSSAYRKEQKAKFLNGEIRNPELDYPELDMNKLDDLEAELLTQKVDLLGNEQNETVKQVYRWRLNEKIAEARLLKATLNGDMRRFARYSEFVYGMPSKEAFEYTVARIREKAQGALSSENDELRRAAEVLLAELPEVKMDTERALPEEDALELAHRQVLEEFSDVINLPVDGDEIEAEGIKEAFEQAIEHLKGDGWDVVIDPDASNISINQERKTARIPEDRRVSKDKLIGLLVHEIGTHIARRINGERSKLKILSLGLDRYEVGEEGVTTLREQAIKNKVEDFAGEPRHLSISLAVGIDGQPRDFRGVYEIIKKLYYFENLVNGKEPEEALTKAQAKAWSGTIRTFRGTDCKTPGVCFTKDIIYREGNISVWDVVQNNPEEMLRFSIGKYDPANSRHIAVLEQLGISDKDLQKLQS
jgi:hypothetical protein